MATREPGPEVFRGDALEDKDEEEESTVKLGDDKSDPQDVFVSAPDTKSEEHQGDACFDGHVRQDVNWFAQPPVL